MGRVEEVAYRLALLSEWSIKEVLSVKSHIVDYSDLDLKLDWSYVEKPVAIIDRSMKTLKQKAIPLVLVSWKWYALGEATWEQDDVH